jgi:hypothetical protein
VAMVYTAERLALAVLENLVHMSPADFPARYVALTVLVPDSVRVVDVSAFRRVLEPDANAGDRWIETRESAVLRVRSSCRSRRESLPDEPRPSRF